MDANSTSPCPGQTIGILNIWSLKKDLRQSLLFFDEFWAYDFEHVLSVAHRDEPSRAMYLADCEYLAGKGIIKDLHPEHLGISPNPLKASRDQTRSLLMNILNEYEAHKESKSPEREFYSHIVRKLESAIHHIHSDLRAENTLLRSASLSISKKHYSNAIPILHPELELPPIPKNKSDQVFDIIIKTLPVPVEDTPLEKILDFRQDESVRGALLAIRNWQNDISRSDLSALEVAARLEHLVHEYESRIKLHKLKYRTGIFNTLVTTTAEVIEHMSRLKFSSAANALFSIQSRKIALLEAERSAAGREVAYIAFARERFQNKSSQQSST